MKIFGFTFDELMESALTKLLFLALVAGALWFFLRAKLTAAFWIGYTVTTLALLWVMVRLVNPIAGDAVFAGGVQEQAERSAESPGGFKTIKWWQQ